MQDTGFGAFLGEGHGLLSFDDVDGAAAAIEAMNSNYESHRRAALDIAREHLDADVVLRSLLDRCGITTPVAPSSRRLPVWTPMLDLTPVARRPLRLAAATVDCVLAQPLPATSRSSTSTPRTTVVMVTHNERTVTRLAVESILTHTEGAFELIVVDNASGQCTRDYIEALAARNHHVRLISNVNNRGFAAAVNQGLRRARGEVVIVVNNDIVVTPGWSNRLLAHLQDPTIGAVGPVTNRCGNEAEIPTSYRTYGEMLAFADECAGAHVGQLTDLPMLVMFCTAIRRDVVDLIGELDERFGIGMFEDDDYARRLAAAGLRMVCAEDVFVHHFGEASFSRLYESGRRSKLFDTNRVRFEEKWGVSWSPHARRSSESYEQVVASVRLVVSELLSSRGSVAVISKGDDRLVRVEGRSAWHFPCTADGSFAGCYPKDDLDATRQLERLEQRGLTQLVVPQPAAWWLDQYPAFRTRLATHYRQLPASSPDALVFEINSEPDELQIDEAVQG
jgi:GT2 family glycosyltransferase